MDDQPEDTIPELFTIEEVSKRLKISTRTLWRYINADVFKSLVVIPRQERRRVLFTKQSIETFIHDFSTGPTEERPKRAYNRTVKKYARKKKAGTRRKAA